MCSVLARIRSRWQWASDGQTKGRAVVLLELEERLVPVEAHDSPARGPRTRQSKRSEGLTTHDASAKAVLFFR